MIKISNSTHNVKVYGWLPERRSSIHFESKFIGRSNIQIQLQEKMNQLNKERNQIHTERE